MKKYIILECEGKRSLIIADNNRELQTLIVESMGEQFGDLSNSNRSNIFFEGKRPYIEDMYLDKKKQYKVRFKFEDLREEDKKILLERLLIYK